MAPLDIRQYTAAERLQWDEFVARSKNGTFLFTRDYMEHHAHRFPDASLMVSDQDGTLRALLPATRRAAELSSHNGLTYGGFVTDKRMTVETMLETFAASLRHLRQAGVKTVVYKPVPHIYHRGPAEEDLYALFSCGAEVDRRYVLSVLDYGAEREWHDRWRWRMRKAGRARRAGLEVQPSEEYERFWELLTANLAEHYGLQPVHTLEEIKLLAGRFPDQIQLFGAYRGAEMDAGAVVYLSDTVCHAQYSANSEYGRTIRGLDLVFAHIIDAFRGRVRYFDFGISNERDGALNEGLLDYKERFGARTVVHDIYRLTLRNC